MIIGMVTIFFLWFASCSEKLLGYYNDLTTGWAGSTDADSFCFNSPEKIWKLAFTVGLCSTWSSCPGLRIRSILAFRLMLTFFLLFLPAVRILLPWLLCLVPHCGLNRESNVRDCFFEVEKVENAYCVKIVAVQWRRCLSSLQVTIAVAHLVVLIYFCAIIPRTN